MASKLMKNSGFLRRLNNLRIQSRSSHDGHHQLSRLEVDIANRNTIDFLPQPKGSWKELNDKRQQVNNTALAVGVILFVSSVVGTTSLGMWNNVLWSPPKDLIRKDFPGAKFVDA